MKRNSSYCIEGNRIIKKGELVTESISSQDGGEQQLKPFLPQAEKPDFLFPIVHHTNSVSLFCRGGWERGGGKRGGKALDTTPALQEMSKDE